MKARITAIALLMGLTAISCSKKKCVCTETQANYDRDISNGTVGSDSKRAKYTYIIGQTALKPDGSYLTQTKEYIDQQVAELEATGKFDCEWSY